LHSYLTNKIKKVLLSSPTFCHFVNIDSDLLGRKQLHFRDENK
jgi:hypothetical protein